MTIEEFKYHDKNNPWDPLGLIGGVLNWVGLGSGCLGGCVTNGFGPGLDNLWLHQLKAHNFSLRFLLSLL